MGVNNHFSPLAAFWRQDSSKDSHYVVARKEESDLFWLDLSFEKTNQTKIFGSNFWSGSNTHRGKKLAFNWLTSCCQTWRKNFLFSFCFLQFRFVEFFQISRQCFWQVWLWLAVRWHSKETLLIGQKFMEFPNGFHTLGKPIEFYVFVVYNLCILKLNKPKIRACGGL